ncbi:GNAT family N-acetyltransferase [Isosphaeraceae bacterium EP7]
MWLRLRRVADPTSDSQRAQSAGILRELSRLASEDMVRSFILFHREHPVSFLHCVARGNDLLYRYAGHDPKFNPWSPGIVLLYLALERLFAEGQHRTFDFADGDGLHKEVFSTRSIPFADLFHFRRSLRHLMLLGLYAGLDASSRAAIGLLDAIGLRRRVKRFVRQTFRAARLRPGPSS